MHDVDWLHKTIDNIKTRQHTHEIPCHTPRLGISLSKGTKSSWHYTTGYYTV